MKNKAQTGFFTLVLFCIVATVVVYMYVYQPKTEETAAIQVSNASLQTRVNTLEQFYLAMPQNKAEMESMTAEINGILEPFPCDVKEEDTIYLALRTIDEGVLVLYDNITIGPREELAVIPVETVQGAKIEGLEQALAFQNRKVTYSNLTTYTNLKDLVNSINENQEELAITNVVYSVNEEGLLEGSVDATFYLVSGTNKEYVPKEFEDYETGLTNLFGEEE